MTITKALRTAGLIFLSAWMPAGQPQVWTLRSGAVEYRLRQGGGAVYLEHFGPAGRPAWPPDTLHAGPAYDISGIVEGQGLRPEDLRLVQAEPAKGALRLLYRHKRLPLEIEALYEAHGETGVITRRLTLFNRGTEVLHVESAPSLAWRLPPGECDLTYLWGGWGQERQLAVDELQAGRRVLLQDHGRSSEGYSPWFALRNDTLGVLYLAQLAWSGNWQMSVDRTPGSASTGLNQLDVAADLGMRFDFGGALALPPGGSFHLPEVAFTATAGDLDDAANQLHRYQRQIFPRRPPGERLRVQYNSWYPFNDHFTVAELKQAADVAAEIGAEVFVLDSGWYSHQDWQRELGDYQPNPAKFPNGMQELSRYVRTRGMQFGLWVEIENAGADSALYRAHPDWCLSYNGERILNAQRCQLNFAREEVRRWARATVDRLIADYDLSWIKIDYNIDIGERFDPAGAARTGDVLYRHLTGYYAWLDEVRAAHPDLAIENCASGGMRFDLGMIAHSHTTWLSDGVLPQASAQLGYGCTVEFAPEICNHWMVGEDERGHVDAAKPPGWWDYMFRVAMNGQFGISSRVAEWTPSLKRRASENVAMYKRLRSVIDGADVYHLTAQPAHNDPGAWMAIQYVAPDAQRSVLLAYRLGRSLPQQIFKLRGLTAGQYEVVEDGQPRGTFTARQLAAGLPVKLDAEWRAAVIELTAVSR